MTVTARSDRGPGAHHAASLQRLLRLAESAVRGGTAGDVALLPDETWTWHVLTGALPASISADTEEPADPTASPMPAATPSRSSLSAAESLMTLARAVAGLDAHTLADTPLDAHELRILTMLELDSPLPLTRIATSLGVDRAHAARACNDLAATGLVSRVEGKQGRRLRAFTLTPNGRRLVGSVRDRRRETFDGLVARLRPEESEHLARGLAALLTVASGDPELAEPSNVARAVMPGPH